MRTDPNSALLPRPDGLHDGIHLALAAGAAVIRVTLDNGAGNRLGLAQIERLHDIASKLGALTPEDTGRVVVLDAAGPDFSHGANLADPALIEKLAEGYDARLAFARLGQALIAAWRAIPVPTIAVAQGNVVGAGACLFLASDFRIAAPGATIRFPEIDRGMHLGWGIVPRLTALLGEPRALRLALLAEGMNIADMGDVVTVTEDLQAEASRLTAQLSAKPPLAARSILKVLRASVPGGEAAADRDAERWAETLASEDFAEAMAAWYERRPASWRGR